MCPPQYKAGIHNWMTVEASLAMEVREVLRWHCCARAHFAMAMDKASVALHYLHERRVNIDLAKVRGSASGDFACWRARCGLGWHSVSVHGRSACPANLERCLRCSCRPASTYRWAPSNPVEELHPHEMPGCICLYVDDPPLCSTTLCLLCLHVDDPPPLFHNTMPDMPLSAPLLHSTEPDVILAVQRQTLENLHYVEPAVRLLHEATGVTYHRFTARGGMVGQHMGNYASDRDRYGKSLPEAEQLRMLVRGGMTMRLMILCTSPLVGSCSAYLYFHTLHRVDLHIAYPCRRSLGFAKRVPVLCTAHQLALAFSRTFASPVDGAQNAFRKVDLLSVAERLCPMPEDAIRPLVLFSKRQLEAFPFPKGFWETEMEGEREKEAAGEKSDLVLLQEVKKRIERNGGRTARRH